MDVPVTHKTIRILCCVVVLLICVGIATAQDAVKLSGFWIEPVTVRDVRNGVLRYQTDQGVDVARPISLLEGLRLQRYPTLSEAQDALERGDDPAAAALFAQVYDQAHEDWVRAYARMQQVGALARSGDVRSAVDVYVDLLISAADLAFVADPPTEALAKADRAVQQELLPLLETARQALDVDRAQLLQALIEAAGQPVLEDDATAGTPDAGAPSPPTKAPALSASVPPGTAANLYRSGNYDQAWIAANEALGRSGRTATELYVKGMCRLALAEQADDQAGYKSAGLSFMRVLTYFPRSAVAGPAYMEAAYVHLKIGRPDIAQKLYERAKALIVQDEDAPAYARLQALAEALKQNTTDD